MSALLSGGEQSVIGTTWQTGQCQGQYCRASRENVSVNYRTRLPADGVGCLRGCSGTGVD